MSPEDTLDLMRDEFSRIASEEGVSDHVRYLCHRATMEITCSVSLISQRDRAEKELAYVRTEVLRALDSLSLCYDIDGNPMKDSDAARHLLKAIPEYVFPCDKP